MYVPYPFLGLNYPICAVQVARYTALVTGIFYGIYHRRTLQKAHDQEKEHHAIHQRQNLIAEAKEAWKKKQEGEKDSGGKSLVLFYG